MNQKEEWHGWVTLNESTAMSTAHFNLITLFFFRKIRKQNNKRQIAVLFNSSHFNSYVILIENNIELQINTQSM